MKNILYILIFLPSLLFSQETKNMELVGVRNISINSDNYNINFEVEEGIIFKILSISHNGGGAPNSSMTYHHPFIRLNGEFIYRSINSGDDYYETSFPFFLSEGIHSLEINYQNEWGNTASTAGTIYGLEFKLTTQ